jgi:hypothetical protein
MSKLLETTEDVKRLIKDDKLTPKKGLTLKRELRGQTLPELIKEGQHIEGAVRKVYETITGRETSENRAPYIEQLALYDFVDDEGVKVEVKFNKGAHRYGSFYIEVADVKEVRKGTFTVTNLTGIFNSEAELLAMAYMKLVDDEWDTYINFIYLEEVKQLILNGDYKLKVAASSHPSAGFIVPMEDVLGLPSPSPTTYYLDI